LNASIMFSTQRGLTVAESLKTAVLTIFLYDYLLTLPREVEVMWPRIDRLSTILYLSIRYLPVGGLIFGISASPETSNCNALVHFVGCLTLLARIGIAVTLTARTYAISSSNRIVLLGLGSLVLIIIIVDSFQVALDTCLIISYKWILINAVVRVVFEAAVVGITVFQTLRAYKLPRGLAALKGNGLINFILRNGIVYFLSVFLLELSSIMVYSFALNQFIGATGSFPLPVSAILISRFLLDLQHLSLHPDGTTAISDPFTSFHFASGNIRAALATGFWEPTISQPVSDSIKLDGISSTFPPFEEELRDGGSIEPGHPGFDDSELREAAPRQVGDPNNGS